MVDSLGDLEAYTSYNSFEKFQNKFRTSMKYIMILVTLTVLILTIVANSNYIFLAIVFVIFSILTFVIDSYARHDFINDIWLIGFNVLFFVQAYFISSAYFLTLLCLMLISAALLRTSKVVIILFVIDLIGIGIFLVLRKFSLEPIIDLETGIALANDVPILLTLLIFTFLIALIISSFYIETIKRITFQNENQKLYQEKILQSSQFKSDFMASMSHELRTPLNSIIGFTDILLETFYGGINEKQGDFLSNVKTSAEQLLHLISEILDISKIEAGKMELNLENIQLQKEINQIQTTIRPEFEKKNLKFELIGLNSNQVIQADRVRFKEIIFNLLSNAVKFTKEGIVKLEIIELEDLWKFSVVDTGIGIKEEHFKTIFTEFARVQSEFVASVQGTGLGLSLTRRLVELHGGNIGFTSKINEGSTFTFAIPKKDDYTQ